MANALTSLEFGAGTEGLLLHQALHGYSEGHRLLESSIPIPDDLKRLMLRMSDLSGTSVLNGFQDYFTGYPLPSLNAYALAKTWYAPEMSRPGCVWTHTFIIPESVMTRITSLSVVRPLFRRPSRRSASDAYSDPILLKLYTLVPGHLWDLDHRLRLQRLIEAHYRKDSSPLIIPASSSDEHTDLIFAAWSQKWPALRMNFTFCTGSLSARMIDLRPLDIQCVPVPNVRQVSREITDAGLGNPLLLDVDAVDLPPWTLLATKDALESKGGPLRTFLWSVADGNSTLADFASFVKIYECLVQLSSASLIVDLAAELFPRPADGRHLKSTLLGNQASFPNLESKAILFSLATTSLYESFDADDLRVREHASRLLCDEPTAGRLLLRELFEASLNPIGDEVLKTLILAIRPDDAMLFANDQRRFLPAIFRMNPTLATSPQLWQVASDRKRELFDSLVAHPEIDPKIVRGIVAALLDSKSEAFLRQAFTQWGSVAVLETLDWTEAHGGSMTDTCRTALSLHVPAVMTWVGNGQDKSTTVLSSLAHVVAPSTSLVAQSDSTRWLQALRDLRENRREDEADYMTAFVLALGLCNAPPAPLRLVSESFERVHRLVAQDKLRDDAWSILQPLVPELSWRKNWDRCERMRRALISAYIRFAWPAQQLRGHIRDQALVEKLLESAHKIDGEYYFKNV